MNQQSKRKTIYTGLLLSAFIFIYASYLYQKMAKRTLIISKLTNGSNISVTHNPPKWISNTPGFIGKFLYRSFPVNIDYNSSENVELFNTSSQKKDIPWKEFLTTVKELEKIEELVLNLQEVSSDETLFFIDELLDLKQVQKLKIFGNRLALKNKTKTSLSLQECYIAAENIAPSVLACLSKSQSMKELLLKSLTPMRSDHLTYLHSFTKLESLMIENLQAKPKDLDFIEKFRELNFLSISTPDRSIMQKVNTQGQSLAQYFDISQNLTALTSMSKLSTLEANILLSKDNLRTLMTFTKIPISYYGLPKTIDDEYLKLFGAFLSKIGPDEEFLKLGLIDKIKTANQLGISDKSLLYFQTYCPATLDLRGTSLLQVAKLPLNIPTRIYFSPKTYSKEILSKLTREEYEILDFSGTSFDDQDLKKLLNQTMPRVLFLDKTLVSDKAIEMLMEYYDEHPKERLKVSFGGRPFPENKRLLFLKRVHQWGMLQVFSSHLDPEISFPTWAMHTSKKIVHDKPGNLEGLDEFFPQLNSINFTGVPLNEKDWHSLKKLRLLHTVSLNSAQQSLAIENSKVLEKIHKLEIRVKPHSPLKLSQNLESCHILLDSGEDLNKYISKEVLPQKLTISGHGSLNLEEVPPNSNLKELTIGPQIHVRGKFPQLSKLTYLKCESKLSEETLKSLSRLSNLAKLSANLSLLTTTTLQTWQALTQLKALDLSSAYKLEPDDLKALLKFPKLEILSLPQNEVIDSRALPILGQIPSLYKLKIIGTIIPSKEIAEKYESPLLWDFLP